MSLYRANSAQRDWRLLPRHGNLVLIKQRCLQMDLGLELHPRLTVLGHAGLERVIGNNETAIGDSNNPSVSNNLWHRLTGAQVRQTMARNQTHHRLGLGMDMSLSDGTNLYIRHQCYGYKDPNFTLNQLSGTETMVELKLTF